MARFCLKQVRNELGITQIDTVIRLRDRGESLTAGTLSAYENGESSPTLDKADAIAAAIGVPTSRIVKFENDNDGKET